MATILVVDDEPMTLNLCVRMLRAGHHDALQASSGEGALQLLQERTADLALIDVVMPGMNGIVLAAEIQRLYRNTEIVLMTGYGPKEIVNIAGKENPYRIIWKPFKTESLLQMIDNVLDKAGEAATRSGDRRDPSA
jgi:DNA-binding NtrC family response regulator